ncbi:MAG: HAMP domain-containing protein [Anaerolineae bacterium]|nr:HAMP domain-containing protein [Anaerolineae bacterium]
MTIRTRLTLWYSSLLATVIIVFSVSLFNLLNWTWREQLLDTMRQTANNVLADIQFDKTTGDLTSRSNPFTLSSTIYSSVAIQVWAANGRLVASSEILRDIDKPFDPVGLNTMEPGWREIEYGGVRLLALTQPIIHKNGRWVGSIQLVASMSSIGDVLNRLVRVMIAVAIVALLLSFMVGTVIAGQALQPIDIISNAAKAITDADDLSKRIPYDGPPDELGQLTNTFNATLERLERLFLVQRRFVADVSHELRTPLTTIQGNLDLIKRMGNDPQSLADIDSEVKRMTRLVGDLLLLAQADSGRLPLRETIVDLESLMIEVYNQLKLISQEVEIKIVQLEPVRVKGDADRLKQLLINLITNAIKYTPPHGKIGLSVTNHDGYAWISVSDTGIGIPEEDLPHIFDRFYRVDKARDRKMGGFGLGLSIVSWIVEAHRGKITATSEEGKGSVFTVQLPAFESSMIPDSARETRIRMPAIRLPRPNAPHVESRITPDSKSIGSKTPDK